MLRTQLGLLALLACCLVFAFPAQASAPASIASQREHFEHEGFMVDVTLPWSGDRGTGYLPVLVDVENPTGEARSIFIELRAGRYRSEARFVATRDLRLEPGDRLRLDFEVPQFHTRQRNVELTLISGGEEFRRSMTVARQLVNKNAPSLAYVTSSLPPDGLGLELRESLADGTVTVGYGSSAQQAPNLAVSVCGLEALPRRAGGYSSLSALVLDVDGRLPQPDALEGLLGWVRSGGHLVVVGEAEVAQLAARVGLEYLLAPRYSSYAESPLRSMEQAPFYLGHGTCAFVTLTRSLAQDPAFIELAQQALQAQEPPGAPSGLARNTEPSKGTSQSIPGLGELPLRFFLLILIAFVIVIGPLNLRWTARRKRPALLLLSVPLISVLTSGGIVAFGMFNQGLGVKAARDTWTVLDHETGHADTHEWRHFYAGLSPGAGWKPQPMTIFWPGEIEGRGETYAVSHRPGRVLSGRFLPVRQPAYQWISSSGISRGRLEWEFTADGLQVRNGFEEAVLEAVLRLDANTGYRVRGPLAPGEAGKAAPESDPARFSTAFHRTTLDRGLERPLFPGAYSARLERSPFADDMGVEFDRQTGRHLVYGLLSLEEMAELEASR